MSALFYCHCFLKQFTSHYLSQKKMPGIEVAARSVSVAI